MDWPLKCTASSKRRSLIWFVLVPHTWYWHLVSLCKLLLKQWNPLFFFSFFCRAAGESFSFLCKSLCHLQTYTSKQFKPSAWNFNYLSWIVCTKGSLWPLASTANRDLVVEFWSLGREKNRKPQREWLWSSVSPSTLTDKHKFRVDMPEKFHWLCRFKIIMTG